MRDDEEEEEMRRRRGRKLRLRMKVKDEIKVVKGAKKTRQQDRAVRLSHNRCSV